MHFADGSLFVFFETYKEAFMICNIPNFNEPNYIVLMTHHVRVPTKYYYGCLYFMNTLRKSAVLDSDEESEEKIVTIKTVNITTNKTIFQQFENKSTLETKSKNSKTNMSSDTISASEFLKLNLASDPDVEMVKETVTIKTVNITTNKTIILPYEKKSNLDARANELEENLIHHEFIPKHNLSSAPISRSSVLLDTGLDKNSNTVLEFEADEKSSTDSDLGSGMVTLNFEPDLNSISGSGFETSSNPSRNSLDLPGHNIKDNSGTDGTSSTLKSLGSGEKTLNLEQKLKSTSGSGFESSLELSRYHFEESSVTTSSTFESSNGGFENDFDFESGNTSMESSEFEYLNTDYIGSRFEFSTGHNSGSELMTLFDF